MALTPLIVEEEGSLIPLTSGLFLILLVLSLGLINLSDSYIAKRELIQIAEAAAQKGAHQLSLADYYGSDSQPSALSQNRIPIDCAAAQVAVAGYVGASSLRNNPVEISNFTCNLREVSVELGTSITPVVSFPIFDTLIHNRLQISATVSAVSLYGNVN